MKPIFSVDEFDFYSQSNYGFCIACQQIIEEELSPDVRFYHCDNCGNFTLFHIEQALRENKLRVEDDDA